MDQWTNRRTKPPIVACPQLKRKVFIQTNAISKQTNKDRKTRLKPNENIFQGLFNSPEYHKVFSRVHATLQPALSVGWSVGPSVCHT